MPTGVPDSRADCRCALLLESAASFAAERIRFMRLEGGGIARRWWFVLLTLGSSRALAACIFSGKRVEHPHRVARQHMMFFQRQPYASLKFPHGSVLLLGPGFEDHGKNE